MTRLAAVISEGIVHHYGRDELLRRLSNPFWFQSFGAVMGMDWHSSTSRRAWFSEDNDPWGEHDCAARPLTAGRSSSKLICMRKVKSTALTGHPWQLVS